MHRACSWHAYAYRGSLFISISTLCLAHLFSLIIIGYRVYEYILCRDFPQEQLERVMGSAEAAAPPGSEGAGRADRQPLNPWQAQHATLICVTVKVGSCSAALSSSLPPEHSRTVHVEMQAFMTSSNCQDGALGSLAQRDANHMFLEASLTASRLHCGGLLEVLQAIQW